MLLSGLKPKLASFVLGKNPQTFVEAVDAASIAEYSIVDSAPDDQLTGQMAVKIYSVLHNAMIVNAAIQNNTPPTPACRVTFQQPRAQANRGPVLTRPQGQGMRSQRPENQQSFVFRGQTTGRGRRGLWGGAPKYSSRGYASPLFLYNYPRIIVSFSE